MESVRTDPRTHYEATLDVRYAIHWNTLNERLHRHIDAALKFCVLLLGSTAFGAYFVARPELSALAGLLMAIFTIVDVVAAPGRKACAFSEARRRFIDLNARAPALSLEALDLALERLRGECTSAGVRALEPVAYNDNLLASGRPDACMQVTCWSRIVAALA